jgi:hypothetical protein
MDRQDFSRLGVKPVEVHNHAFLLQRPAIEYQTGPSPGSSTFPHEHLINHAEDLDQDRVLCLLGILPMVSALPEQSFCLHPSFLSLTSGGMSLPKW